MIVQTLEVQVEAEADAHEDDEEETDDVVDEHLEDEEENADWVYEDLEEEGKWSRQGKPDEITWRIVGGGMAEEEARARCQGERG